MAEIEGTTQPGQDLEGSELEFQREATALLAETGLGSPVLLAFSDCIRFELAEMNINYFRTRLQEGTTDVELDQSLLRQAELESVVTDQGIKTREVTVPGYGGKHGAYSRVQTLFDKFAQDSEFDKRYILEYVTTPILDARITQLNTPPSPPQSNT